jgi:phenylalanyl-tRNA synthetase beta chain
MKISSNWINEWLNQEIKIEDLTETLVMLGLVVASVEEVGPDFNGVVVGEILSVNPHPNADRLRVCQVKISAEETLEIVCGASNVAVGMKVPLAKIGAKLKNLEIKKSKLRGVDSFGMICSAKELGIAKESEGILGLPKELDVGIDLSNYFGKKDYLLEVEITPNRGDCLSILGIARDVAAARGYKLSEYKAPRIKFGKETFSLEVSAPLFCPHYCGAVLKGINTKATTPFWIKERLEKCGIRSLHPVVDVTNYVMLELGQPMHAFDLEKLEQKIEVRLARGTESLTLLDGKNIKLGVEDLVIADQSKVLALAGVMGGNSAEVNQSTKDIFLESAFFNPEKIFISAKKYGISTESSYRFERGVDFKLQANALKRSLQLLQEVVGGKVGKMIEFGNLRRFYPKPIIITFEEVEKLLGIKIHKNEIKKILKNLGMKFSFARKGMKVYVPSFRFGIYGSHDLIEEIARVYGYQKIPETPIFGPISSVAQDQFSKDRKIKSFWRERGFHEIVTYSFIDPKWYEILGTSGEHNDIVLKNPLSKEMSMMRKSLIPGLLKTLEHNYHRQAQRLHIFEIGNCFLRKEHDFCEEKRLAVLIAGDLDARNWANLAKPIDFFDLKNELLNFLKLLGLKAVNFTNLSRGFLHPQKSAEVLLDNEVVGYIGEIHPKITQMMEINLPICIFEINLSLLNKELLTKFREISKFPLVTRDLSMVIDRKIPWKEVEREVIRVSGNLLQDVEIFDVYQGEKIGENRKSIAIRMGFQNFSKTLLDQEIEDLMQKIASALEKTFNAELRR